MAEEMAGTSELPLMAERVCIVCYEKSDGSHFGVDSCRACAAFWRRTIVSGRKYYCNQGEGRCEINKAARCMCRKCRFEKCFAVGMRREMVQGRRDPINPNRNTVVQTVLPFPIGGNFPLPVMILPLEPNLLQKISANYKELRSKRKVVELTLYPELAPLLHIKGALQGFTCGTSEKLLNLTKAFTPALWEFALKSFDEFAALENHNQVSLFSSFATLIWGMDKAYMTYKSIPKEYYDTISIVSETLYFDKNNCEFWISDCPPTCEPVKCELITVMKAAMSRPRLKQVFLMEQMQIEEEEYVALLGLMLWSHNFEEGCEKIDELVNSMRKTIFQQLENYYKSKGMSSYSERLGALMGVHGTALVDVFRMREDMELYNLLNAISNDSSLLQSLRNIRRF